MDRSKRPCVGLRTLAAVTLLAGLSATAAAAGPRVPTVTGNARVDRLLATMTLAEKRTLIHDAREDPATYQGQAGYIAGIPRLGIPGLRLADGPPGVLTRHPAQAETATMGVAASFDVKLAEQNGVVIGRDARALGIDVSLQPFINLDRDLAFRRAYNTFGEDPLLTARIGAAEIRGIQSQHVMAVAKHFVGYDSTASDVWIDEQALHELYLPPFEAAVQAGVAAVMCAYNHVNGPHACGSRPLLTSVLREQFGFRGFVISDWGANHSAQFMKAGLDVEMIDGPDSTGYQEPAFFGAEAAARPAPTPPGGEPYGDIYGGSMPEEPQLPAADEGDHGAPVPPETIDESLKKGTLAEVDVTRAAGRVLLQMERFGFLDGAATHAIRPRAVEANARVIERTAIEAAVLLKNEAATLPLRPADLDSVVLIGPTAGQVDAIGINGERSMGLPQRQVGPLEALRQLSGHPGIRFAVADDMSGTPVPAGALSHDGAPGLRRSDGSIDALVDFTQAGGNALPPDSRTEWTGTLNVDRSRPYWLYLQVLGTDASLYVDGQRVGITGTFQGDVHGDILQANQDNAIPTPDGLDNLRRAVELSAGPHAIRIVLNPDSSQAPVQVRLAWTTPAQREADHTAAIEAARHAKLAVVFVWARRVPAFTLVGDQNRLIEEVAAVNPNTVVVLNTSQPVAMPWADRVKSILQMWWPGDEGGWATAKLLLGQANPAGRLPMTWAERLEDYPATDPRHPERSTAGVDGRTRFSEGLYIGYRGFDHENRVPQYPFGHGLSYTRFDYSSLVVRRAKDGGLDLRVRIRNRGTRAGDEVPQTYLGAPEDAPSGVQFAKHSLAAFDRIHLAAGQGRTVSMHVPLRSLQYWSVADGRWITASGRRSISVGASSRDLRLTRTLPPLSAARASRSP